MDQYSIKTRLGSSACSAFSGQGQFANPQKVRQEARQLGIEVRRKLKTGGIAVGGVTLKSRQNSPSTIVNGYTRSKGSEKYVE